MQLRNSGNGNRWPQRSRLPLCLTLLLLSLTACGEPPTGKMASGGDPHRGAKLIRQYGCGACHSIPGIPSANGQVGPGLEHIARRSYLGGVLPNYPRNMVRWLLEPHAIAPDSAMPAVGLSAVEARHITAYLYTLE